MTRTVDLNADLGEDASPQGMARDIAIMDIVSSCNIACGGHAGSPAIMRAMLTAAKQRAIAPGAHPSYPDRAGFGRQSLDMPLRDLESSLNDQCRTLEAIAAEVGVALTHIKPHGALYNDAQDNPDLSALLVRLAARAGLALVSMPGSLVERTAAAEGVAFVAEAFIDRQYAGNGRLVPRREAGAVIADEEERIRQGLALAEGRALTARDGSDLTIAARSLCLHSDSDGALATARTMRRRLEQAGIGIGSPGE